MLVGGVVGVEFSGGVVVFGEDVDGERRGDERGGGFGELDEEDGTHSAGGVFEPGTGVGEDGGVGFGEAAFEDEGGVFGVGEVDGGVGFAGGERHGGVGLGDGGVVRW